jgi:ATP-grasp domain, R2K clade family 2
MLLILTPNSDAAVNHLAEAAMCVGWEIYRPVDGWRIPFRYKRNGVASPGAIYGDDLFCLALADQMEWTLHRNKGSWLASLPDPYKQRLIFYTQVKFARSMQTPKFMEPADLKSAFPAQIYRSGKYLPPKVAIDNDPILISDILTFQSKYRTFIQKRQVVAETCYEWAGQYAGKDKWRTNARRITDYVNDMLKDSNIECAPGTVIDVGILGNGNLAVIGCAPAWRAKIYAGCDFAAVLAVIKDSCSITEIKQ